MGILVEKPKRCGAIPCFANAYLLVECKSFRTFSDK